MIQKGNAGMVRWYFDENQLNRGRSLFIRCIYCDAPNKLMKIIGCSFKT